MTKSHLKISKTISILPETTHPQKPTLLHQLYKLSRSQMTTISALTYLTSYLYPLHLPKTSTFLLAHLFIITTQLMVHFLGEINDAPSDILNVHASRFTGGSKMFNGRLLGVTRLASVVCGGIGFVVGVWIGWGDWLLMGVVLGMWGGAWAYSGWPVLLNHCGWGEVVGGVVTSGLVCLFGGRVGMGGWGGGWVKGVVGVLVIPGVLGKIGLFLLLNAADRRADWAGGKLTLVVKLGEEGGLRLRRWLVLGGYGWLIGLGVLGGEWCGGFGRGLVWLVVLGTGWSAWTLERDLGRKPRPYRLDRFLGRALMQSTGIVWVVLIYVVAQCLVKFGWDFVFSMPMVYLVGITGLTLKKMAAVMMAKRGKQNDTCHHGCDEKEQLTGKHQRTESEGDFDCHPPAEHSSTRVKDCKYIKNNTNMFDVIIVGGGIGGLVAAATCKRLGLRCLVLEKRASDSHDKGADLALWPSAIRILESLGVDPQFFAKSCFPVNTVDMCKLNFASSKSLGEEEELLKRINMAKVVEGKGASFVHVPRKELLEAINPLVQGGITFEYGSTVTNLEEQEELGRVQVEYANAEGVQKSANARVCIGADGARSTVRRRLVSTKTKKRERRRATSPTEDDIKFCDEVCYRGILRRDNSPKQLFQVIEENNTDGKMKINYGAGLRSSFGFMSGDHSVAYWWVKTPASTRPTSSSAKLESCSWPEPLKSLHDATPAENFYVHAIEEGEDLPKWSALRTTLIGDAAHVLSPNMGQGACLAVEDAFIFSCFLKEYWMWDDGHLEAMYEYERVRRHFVAGVRAEARKQLFLGQLKNPLLVKVRELLLKNIPTKVLEKKLVANCFAIDDYLEKYREFTGKNNIV